MYKTLLNLFVSIFILCIIITLMACINKKLIITFNIHEIDSLPPNNPWAKIAADIDKDGISDIIIGGQKGPLVWYKYPQWTNYKIAEGGYNTVDGEACDLDKDGDLDFFGANWSGKYQPLQLWENTLKIIK